MKLKNTHRYYIYKRDNKKCFFCDKKLKYRQITLDHYLPLSKGGINEVFNMVTSCKKCNKYKKDNIPRDYRKKILKLFIQAVKDDIITGKNIDMNNKTLKNELLEVHRVERITDNYISFQNYDKRFYIKKNKVIQISYLG